MQIQLRAEGGGKPMTLVLTPGQRHEATARLRAVAGAGRGAAPRPRAAAAAPCAGREVHPLGDTRRSSMARTAVPARAANRADVVPPPGTLRQGEHRLVPGGCLALRERDRGEPLRARRAAIGAARRLELVAGAALALRPHPLLAHRREILEAPFQHICSSSDQDFYGEIGELPVVEGRFQLSPHWRRDCVAQTRRLLEFPEVQHAMGDSKG